MTSTQFQIADPNKSPRECLPNERLVYWFGDCTKSVIDIKDLVSITKFAEVYQPSKKGIYRVALYDFLSDAAESCNYTEVNAPDSVNIDETALSRLIKWALDGFIPGGPPSDWAPSDHYNTRGSSGFIKRLDVASKPFRGEVCVAKQVCVACQERAATHPHPLFEEYRLCDTCLEDFSQCAFLFGDDGAGESYLITLVYYHTLLLHYNYTISTLFDHIRTYYLESYLITLVHYY